MTDLRERSEPSAAADSSWQAWGDAPSLAWRGRLALLSLLGLLLALVLFVLYARGTFEKTQQLTLVTDNSEGVSVGMDLSFAGFPIGRVRSVSLAEDGEVHIQIDVPQADARWLRRSSVFTLERSLVGSTRLRAFSGIQDDPPLPPGAQRPLLRGDAADELPRLMNTAREILHNVQALTAAEGALAQSLQQMHMLSSRLNGPGGAIEVLLGSPAEVQRVLRTLDHSQKALASAAQLMGRLDAMARKADEQLLGPKGLSEEARGTVLRLQALLDDTRQSLKAVDKVLEDAQATSRNVREGTQDLGALRGEVESSLRRVDHLVDDLARRWPFSGAPSAVELP